MYRISINLIINSLAEFKKFYQRIIDYTDDYDYYELILLDKTKDKDFYKYYLNKLDSISNIKYINGQNLESSELYNKGIELSQGEYLNFTSTSVFFSNDYIYKIGYYLEDNKIDVLTLKNAKGKIKNKGFIDLEKDNFILDKLDGYFFKKDIISLTRFSNKIDSSFSKIKFIIDVLMKKNKCFFIKEIKYKDDIDYCLDKKFYNDFFKDFLLIYLKKSVNDLGSIPLCIQKYVLGVIVDRFNLNRNCSILDKKEEKIFNSLISKTLAYILDDIIINYDLDKYLLIYLLKLKDKSFKIEVKDNYLYFNNIKSNLISDELFIINKIDIKDKDLVIEGYFSINLEFEINLDFNGKKCKGEKRVFSDLKFFNTEINNYLYIYKIKIDDLEKINIRFMIEAICLEIDFNSIFSKIKKSVFSNYKIDKRIMYWKNKGLVIKKNIFRGILFYLNIINLFYIVLSFFFKKNLVVLFEPFKYDYILDNSLYNVYYIDNDNFNYKDVSFKKIKKNSLFLSLYLYYSDLIIGNDFKEINDLLISDNSYIKSRFRNNIIIMPSIRDENNKKWKNSYNSFIDYIDKLK